MEPTDSLPPVGKAWSSWADQPGPMIGPPTDGVEHLGPNVVPLHHRHRDTTDEPTLELSAEELWCEHKGIGYTPAEAAAKLRSLAQELAPAPPGVTGLPWIVRVEVRSETGVTVGSYDTVLTHVGDGHYNIPLPGVGTITVARVQ